MSDVPGVPGPPPAKRRQTTLSNFNFFTVSSGSPAEKNPGPPPKKAPAVLPPTSPIPTVADNDIGLAVGDDRQFELSAEHRIKFLTPWRPTCDQDYPSSTRHEGVTKEGEERRRRLLPRHLDMYQWLAVSKVDGKQGAFCVPCVLSTSAAGVGGRSRGHGQLPGKLVTKPLDRFDELTGKNGALTRHQLTEYHQSSILAMDDFKKVVLQHDVLDIHSILDNAHKKEVEGNRALLVPIVDTILTCARQNMAFRGHRGESGSVSADGLEPVGNDGNFRALLRYRIRGGDTVLQAHVRTAAKNATYQSPDIQNELISAAGDLVKESVLRRIKEAKFWVLLADETTDRHHREQLTVVVRYLLPDENGMWHCFEDPIAIVDVYATIQGNRQSGPGDGETRLTGTAIATILLQIIRKLGLNLATCVGQGYDGAAALSSERVGAATQFKRDAINAHYYHCSMHCLNLSASKAVSIAAIRHAQDVVKETTTCFHSSAKRSSLLTLCIAEADDTRVSKTQLTTLCTTRFIERHTAIVCFRSLLAFIMDALDCMASWQSTEARKTANSLKNSICQSDFVVSLVILEHISGLMLPTTRALQTVGLDLVEAMHGVDDLVSSLRSMRSAEHFTKLFQEASNVASTVLGISLAKPRIASRSKYRPTAAVGVGADDTAEEYYRINVYFPALDSIIQDVELRFGAKQKEAMHLCHVIPACMKFGDGEEEQHWEQLETAISNYADLFSDPAVLVKSEFRLWRQKWKRMPVLEHPKSAISALITATSSPT
jgi:hypothetical protein